MEEANGADNSLDVVVSRRKSHQFSKQDKVLRLGRKKSNSKEDRKADPLSDVAEDISGGGFSIVI